MYEKYDGYVVEGEWYEDADAAYIAFKRLYDKSLGKATRRRIGNVTTRKHVISHRGVDFEDGYVEKLNEEFARCGKVNCYILGIVGISYGYMFGEWGFDPAFCEWDDDRRERYVDWLIAAGSTGVRMCGRKDKLVRYKVGKMTYGRYIPYKSKKSKAQHKWKTRKQN